MASIILIGDESLAGKYLSWAKNQLSRMKRSMEISGLRSNSKMFVLENKRVRISISSSFLQDRIMITADSGGFVIVCYVGDTTGDFSSKRFYNEEGNELARDEPGAPGMAPGWALIDDGLYGLNSFPPDPDNPWNNAYAYDPGGLGVPACGSGISAKSVAGRSGRYILNGAIEDEAWTAWSWTITDALGLNPYVYDFLQPVDSLILAPYAYYGPKPYFTQYLGGKIVTMIVPWDSFGATFLWAAYNTHPVESFLDVLPKVTRAWAVDMATGIPTGVSIPDYGDGSDAISAAYPFVEDEIHKVRMVHANTFEFGGYAKEAEPFREEVLRMDTGSVTAGEVHERCPDPNDFFRDPYASLGSISDDVPLIFGISATGKKSYVRIQKTGDFDTVNIGVYCGDALVEESGWLAPIKILSGDTYGPIYIHPVRYRIIQSHQQDGFNAIVYSKTVYVSHASELLDYSTYDLDPANRKLIRRTEVVSSTSYHVGVNGAVTDLGYSNVKREYKLTVSPDAPSFPYPPTVNGGLQDLPWVDAGYDSAGASTGDDNSVVMRCDTSAAGGKLFLGFDVYPLEFRHDLSLSVPDAYLVAEYDTGVFMFPPSSDAGYPDVKDRKWMIFGSDGEKIKDLTPPQKPAGGHVRRINGLAFIGA